MPDKGNVEVLEMNNPKALTTTDGLRALEIISPIEWEDESTLRKRLCYDAQHKTFDVVISKLKIFSHSLSIPVAAALFMAEALEKLDKLGVRIVPDFFKTGADWMVENIDGAMLREQKGDWGYTSPTSYNSRLEAIIAAVLALEDELKGMVG